MSLSLLPPELLHRILLHLDIPSLLSFALTSHTNHLAHAPALHTLDLAVLPKRIHCLIAFLASPSFSSFPTYHPGPHQIGIILPPSPSYTDTITRQNTHLTTLLSRYPTLSTLTFHAYALLPCSAILLSQSPTLRHLSLNFSHRHASLPDSPPLSSSLWNSLCGLGIQQARELKLRNLRSLALARCGLTSAQLRSLLGANPGLREVRLVGVKGVDGEFCDWLGEKGAKVEVLVVEKCESLVLRAEEDFAWVERMRVLKELRVERCKTVDGGLLRELRERLGLRGGEGRKERKEEGGTYDFGGVMEVDEACF